MIDDDGAAALEVGFIINTEGAFAELLKFGQMFSAETQDFIRNATRIEAAAGGIKLAGATSAVASFGAAATREGANAAREFARVEKAGEAMVRQLERQGDAFGRTREQMRGIKAETAALAAEQKGLTELAERIRAAEASIYDKESAAAAKARTDVAALADEKAAAAQQAAAAAAVEAQAVRSAALAYAMFEAAAARGVQAMKDQAAAARASEMEAHAQEVRSAARAYDLFEAAARQGAKAMREQEAAQQAAGRERQAAIGAADSYTAKLESEAAALGRTTAELRAMEVAQRAAAAEAAGLPDQADRIRAAGAAYAQTATRVEALAAEERALAQATREAEQAAESDAAALARLRAILDPAAAAQDRLNAELAEAVRILKEAGASAEEVARVQQVLTNRLAESGRSSGAAKASMQNLGFQLQDFSVQVVGGTSVLRAFAMQFPQAAGALTGFEGKLGKVGGFLAGPWGIALTLGITLLAGFADKLFETGDAAEKAADGLKKFQDRQSDIGNFIDSTTGKLTEQNRTLVLNAILTRQAAIAENNKAITEQRNAAFRTAGNQQTRAPSYTGSSIGAPIAMRQTDPDVQRAIQAAAGDVDKLASSIAKLAATSRPDLKPLALQISTTAGAAIIATRENAKLGKELRGLSGDTTALAGSTTALIGKQVALATATEPLARARAQLAIVEQGAAAADKAGGAALVRYRTDLTAATKAVNAAEAAQKAAAAAKSDSTKASNHAAAEARKDANHVEKLATDAEAVEAQIRNLGSLTAAYGQSGAAALVAEAQFRAESKAIKDGAVVAEAVAREVRLMTAQRINEAAKGTAAMRDQAMVQEAVNAEVAAGNVPAARAAELVRDRMADLPLLAALETAQKAKDQAGIDAVTDALEKQRVARLGVAKADADARFQASTEAGANRLAELAEELRLVGKTNDEREIGLATIRATQEAAANNWTGKQGTDYVDQQVAIVKSQQAVAQANDSLNASLTATADLFDTVDQTAQRAAQGMADAFGRVGSAIGDAATVMTAYYADQAHLQQTHDAAIKAAGTDQTRIARENQLFALRTASAQVAVYGDMASAAKGFFKEGTAGYKAMATAEKVFRAVEFAMAVKNAAVQLGLIGGVTAARTVAAATGAATDTAFTASSVANSAVRATADGTAAMAKTAASSPFPFNLAGMAVMAAALASIGVFTGFFGGGGKNTLPKANEGTGTVLGDTAAQSESLKRSMDALKEVDTLTNTYARQMAASLKSIDSQIGNVAALVVRAGDVNASAGVKEGFASDTTGKLLSGIVTGGGLFSKIPVVGSIIGAVGGLIGSLFGSKTTVVGSGLYGKDQQLGSILGGGFDASYYSDVEKKKKFLGISTGTSYSTKYTGADAGLENQFTLILRQFNDAITAAAGPLGVATGEVQARLNSFVVSIGKIDLKDLTGEQIQEKLTAVFGAAADKMATAAFPGFERFQKVGEGAFETLVRVASTIEAVGNSLDLLGTSATGFSIDAKLALADQFDSVSDLTSAAGAYFEAFYTKEEQAAAKTAQFARVFDSLGVAMPASLSGFRALVEAQDLTTTAGQSTYATLLKLAPAFADLQSAMEGARSAADIAAERQDLERKLLELKGDTATLRALDLAKLDVSNRALQQQIWAIQDAQEAAKAAEALRDAWASVGDGLMDEVKRIRGLTDAGNGNGFAALQGQFNTATSAARGGDQDAAKGLPALSQALLAAAAEQATSRQELERVRAMTAASLEATYGVISALGNGAAVPTVEQATSRQELDRVQAMTDASRQAAYGVVSALAGGTAASGKAVMPIDTMIAAADVATGRTPTPANDDLAGEIAALREEVAGLRRDSNSAQAEIARNTKGTNQRLDDITADHDGQAISVGNASTAR